MTPLADLDPLLHSPKRLAIVSILSAVEEVEFSYLRTRLEITDSDLSKQMSKLCKQGVVSARKEGGGRSSKTWFALSLNGRRSFDTYKKTLLQIVNHSD